MSMLRYITKFMLFLFILFPNFMIADADWSVTEKKTNKDANISWSEAMKPIEVQTDIWKRSDKCDVNCKDGVHSDTCSMQWDINWPMPADAKLDMIKTDAVRGEACEEDFECDDSCNAQLKIVNLCTKTVRAKCVESLKVKSKCICANRIDADDACVNRLNIPDQLTVENLSAREACLDNVVANNLCAGKARFNELEYCSRIKATATFPGDFHYNLGHLINWNDILDDPNGNLHLAPPVTFYEAPSSGYYIITVHVNIRNLRGNEFIFGTPFSQLKIVKNNILLRQVTEPFLIYQRDQSIAYSGLIRLKAGDRIATSYDILALTPFGFQPYVGTVDIIANGTDENTSLFKIHFLGLDCPQSICRPCQVPQVTGCAFPCRPCPKKPCDADLAS